MKSCRRYTHNVASTEWGQNLHFSTSTCISDETNPALLRHSRLRNSEFAEYLLKFFANFLLSGLV